MPNEGKGQPLLANFGAQAKEMAALPSNERLMQQASAFIASYMPSKPGHAAWLSSVLTASPHTPARAGAPRIDLKLRAPALYVSQQPGTRSIRMETSCRVRLRPTARRPANLVEHVCMSFSAASGQGRLRVDTDVGATTAAVCSAETSVALMPGLWFSAMLGTSQDADALGWGAAVHIQPWRAAVLHARLMNDTSGGQNLRLQSFALLPWRLRAVAQLDMRQEQGQPDVTTEVGCRLELWGRGSESGGLSVDKVLGHHSDTSAGHVKGCIASVSGTLVLQSAMKPSVGLQWRVQC